MSLKGNITLVSPYNSRIKLTFVNKCDIELLRKWKNDNRQYFFFQNNINPDQQLKWYRNFLKRENDFMFVVEFDDQRVGCMRFRLINRTIDIYNVILGKKYYSQQKVMSNAIQLMISYMKEKFAFDIFAKVLINNPALNWYLKNGFKVIEKKGQYFQIKLVNTKNNNMSIW